METNKKKGSFQLGGAVLLFILLAGCRPTGDIPTTNGAVNSTALPTLTETARPTATIAPTLTRTPLPTLSLEEQLALAEDLFTNNAGCRLPCWWGFTPGSTNWEEAKRYLALFANEVGDKRGSEDNIFVNVQFQVPEEMYFDDYPGFIWNTYFINNNIIEAIEIDIPRVFTNNLPNMLREYGSPKEIYIYTYPEEEFHKPRFHLYLFYKNQGIFLYYEVDAEDLGDTIIGCFGDEKPGSMMLWDSEQGWTFKEVTEKMVGARIGGYPLEAVSDFTLENFYETFKEVTTPQCITVPISELPGY